MTTSKQKDPYSPHRGHSWRNLVVPTFTPLIAYRPDAIGFGTVPQGTKRVEIAQDWSLVANGKNNTMAYMPYSFNAIGDAGVQGYARIATVTVTSSAWAEHTIHFHGIRRVDNIPFDLYFALAGASCDPPLKTLCAEFPIYTTNPQPFEAFAYKTATNTWDICVRKCSGSDQITIWTYIGAYAQAHYTVTYSDYQYSSVPSGATMATSLAQVTYLVKGQSQMSGVSTSSSSNETMRYWRSGNTVTILIDVILASATWTDIYTLETAYRPPNTVWGAIPKWGGVADSVTQYYNIFNDGRITLYSSSNTSRLYFTVTYAV